MTVSLNWLKTFIEVAMPPSEIADLLTSLGLEVEGMEEVASIKGGLQGVVTGEVLEIWKHPNADKLTLTRVSTGAGAPLQIVCGAPNVAAGQKVLVALTGATLYPLEGEPIKLKQGNIRGEVSEGMICAEDELGIGTDHSGILVLPAETPVGMPASEYFGVENDVIFEIGLTPNRTDATSHLGVACDLAAALRYRHRKRLQVQWPAVDDFPEGKENAFGVQVFVENEVACPRYSGVVISGVTVGESPNWIENRLRSIGVRPINNIVDATNFVLHELGQPLHAFDLDRIAGRTIRVKTLPEGSKFVSLDEQERTLYAEDLMICDGDSKPLCIGGVFGGHYSGVTADTTSIFLESAYFHPEWIRRSSTRHNLRTDAAKVFEKGADPKRTVYALKRAALLICELAGGSIASPITDVYPQPVEPCRVAISFDYIKRIIGVAIPDGEVRQILEALEMPIIEENGKGLTVEVPTNKADVTRPADVAEEILRVYGLNNVPVSGKMAIPMAQTAAADADRLRQMAADYLAANGFHEIMSLSLTQSGYFTNTLPLPAEQLVHINNTANATLDVMRPTMLISGLEAMVHNQSRQQHNLKLFEFGRTYHRLKPEATDQSDVTELFSEPQHLALFLSGNRWAESWRVSEKPEPAADFFTLKAFVGNVLERLGISGFQQTELQDDCFAFGLKYHSGQQPFVSFGKVKPGIMRKLGLRNEVFYADFNWDTLAEVGGRQTISFQEPGRFPTVRRDLALVLDRRMPFAELAALARKTEGQLLTEVNLFDVFEEEQRLGKGKKSYTLSFTFENRGRTLTDEEIDTVVSKLIRVFEEKLQAVVRR